MGILAARHFTRPPSSTSWRRNWTTRISSRCTTWGCCGRPRASRRRDVGVPEGQSAENALPSVHFRLGGMYEKAEASTRRSPDAPRRSDRSVDARSAAQPYLSSTGLTERRSPTTMDVASATGQGLDLRRGGPFRRCPSIGPSARRRPRAKAGGSRTVAIGPGCGRRGGLGDVADGPGPGRGHTPAPAAPRAAPARGTRPARPHPHPRRAAGLRSWRRRRTNVPPPAAPPPAGADAAALGEPESPPQSRCGSHPGGAGGGRPSSWLQLTASSPLRRRRESTTG
jgi:hypothetical protein